MKSSLALSAPLSRAFRCSLPPPAFGVRCLSRSAPAWSGHSKWSSIKHDKGKNDKAKSNTRSILTRDISAAVKVSGPDPTMNPRLALALTKAKKNAVPKASIEAAIARGQGLSPSGAALESITLEAILPPSVAIVIEGQTDSKLKLLVDLRVLVKDAGGNVSSVSYMFEKKGRIIFRQKDGVGADEVLEHALDEDVLGVLDVIEDEQGRVVVFTEPAQAKTTAGKLTETLELEVEDTEIVWDPNEDTKVPVDSEDTAQQLGEFMDEVQEVMGVQGVYTNWKKGSISDETWANLQSKICA